MVNSAKIRKNGKNVYFLNFSFKSLKKMLHFYYTWNPLFLRHLEIFSGGQWSVNFF